VAPPNSGEEKRTRYLLLHQHAPHSTQLKATPWPPRTQANQSFYGLKNNPLLAIDCYLLVAHKIDIIAVSIILILLYNWWPLISHY